MTKLDGYIDGNGLVSNALVEPGTKRASDNGVLFSSQAILLGFAGLEIFNAVTKCIDERGRLHRAPDDTSPDAPDDYYGLLSVAHALRFKTPIRLDMRLWHPVIIYLWLSQSSYWPLSYLLSPVVALIIAFSNLGSPISDTSNRLLTWTISQSLKRRGLLTKLAAHVWEYRQKRIYKNLSNIFAIYFSTSHPFYIEVKENEKGGV